MSIVPGAGNLEKIVLKTTTNPIIKALKEAALSGSVEVLEKNINSMAATKAEHEAIFSSLVNDLVPENFQETILFMVASAGLQEVVDYIIKNSKYTYKQLAEFRNGMGDHFLLKTLAESTNEKVDLSCVHLVLKVPELRHLINVPDRTDDITPLYLAVRYNKAQVTRLLIASGVDFQAKLNRFAAEGSKYWNETVYEILKPSQKICLESFRILEAAEGFDSYSKGDDFRHSRLWICVHNGASMHQRDKDGNTPLHTAVLFSNPLVEEVMKYGADIEAVNNKGLTALDIVKTTFQNKSDQYKLIGSIQSLCCLANEYARELLKKNEPQKAAKFIALALLACAEFPIDKNSYSTLYGSMDQGEYIYIFAMMIKNEHRLIQILKTESVIALLKRIPKKSRSYSDAQLEIATLCYMNYKQIPSQELDSVEQLQIAATTQVISLIQEAISGSSSKSEPKAASVSRGCSPDFLKEVKHLGEEFNLNQNFEEFIALEEEYFDPNCLLKKAYIHICQAKVCDEAMILRKEIIGSLLGLGMKVNSLDTLNPEDGLTFIEEHRTLTEQNKKQAEQLEMQAKKIAAQDKRILELENALKKLQQQSAQVAVVEESETTTMEESSKERVIKRKFV